MYTTHAIAMVCLLLALTACGGGGDDPIPPPTATPAPVPPPGVTDPFNNLVADQVRGKTLYMSICARCHAPEPRLDVRGVNGAAGTPGNILSAIESINRMRFLVGQISPQDAVDIATWIADPV